MPADTINGNTISARGAIRALTTQTLHTLYVGARSGSHNNHVVGVEITPDGTNWFTTQHSVTGVGCKTFQEIGVGIRPVILETEGEAASLSVEILSR